MFGLLNDEDTGLQIPEYQPCDFMYRVASPGSEMASFWQLRRQIFCGEQDIFRDTDKDQYDEAMIPLICSAMLAGMEDRVVGCVRIDERVPGVWWGSRLGVDRDFRNLRCISPGVAVRNRQPAFYAKRSIGAGLIFKAVSLAHSLGCHTFLAHVQPQNVTFFRRLHWRVLGEVELLGIVHTKMSADLRYYPAEQRLPAEVRLA